MTNYLLKNTPPEALIKAVKDAYYDRSSIGADIAGKLRREFRRVKVNENSLLKTFSIVSQLTPAEIENLELLLSGYSRTEICERRHVEYSTLKTQIYSILKKFDKRRMEEVLTLLQGIHFLDMIKQSKKFENQKENQK